MLANVEPLIGRHMVAKSGNVARVERIGVAGARAVWEGRPTEQDEADFCDWAEGIIGPLVVEQFTAGKISEGARRKDKQAYQEWLRKLGRP